MVEQVPVVDGLDNHAEAGALGIHKADQRVEDAPGADPVAGADLRDQLQHIHQRHGAEHGPQHGALPEQPVLSGPQAVAQHKINHEHQHLAHKRVPFARKQRSQHIDPVNGQRQLHLPPARHCGEKGRERGRKERGKAADGGGDVVLRLLDVGAEIPVAEHIQNAAEERVKERERADQQHGHADLPDHGQERVPAHGAAPLLAQGGFPAHKQRRRELVRRVDEKKGQRDNLQGVEQRAEVPGLQPVQDMLIVAKERNVDPPEQQQVERGGENQQRKIAPDVCEHIRQHGDVQRRVRREHHADGGLLVRSAQRRQQVRDQHQNGEGAKQHRVPQTVSRAEMFRRHGRTSLACLSEFFILYHDCGTLPIIGSPSAFPRRPCPARQTRSCCPHR